MTRRDLVVADRFFQDARELRSSFEERFGDPRRTHAGRFWTTVGASVLNGSAYRFNRSSSRTAFQMSRPLGALTVAIRA